MKKFSAVHVENGTLRRMVFEATSSDEALFLARKWGVGLEGETVELGLERSIPEAFQLNAACEILGNVSRQTVWRWLTEGRLSRVEGCRRVLITRKSIERLCSERATKLGDNFK